MARPLTASSFNEREASIIRSLIATQGVTFPENPYLLKRVVRALLHRIEILSHSKATEARLLLRVMVAHEHRLQHAMNLKGAKNTRLAGTFLLHNPSIQRQLQGLAAGTILGSHWIDSLKEQRRILVQYIEESPLPDSARNIDEWSRRLKTWSDDHKELFSWLTAIPCLHSYTDPFLKSFSISKLKSAPRTPGMVILAILAHLHSTTTSQVAKLLKPSSRS